MKISGGICASCGVGYTAGHLCGVVACNCAKRVLQGNPWKWCGEQHCPVLDFLDNQDGIWNDDSPAASVPK